MASDRDIELKKLITLQEKRTKYPYLDDKGNISIGLGYNLTARGVTDQWIDEQYNQDVAYHDEKLKQTFTWYNDLTDPRQCALISLSYNVGWQGFLLFKQLISYLSQHDYISAANAILDSQLGKDRKEQLALMMRTGAYLAWNG